MALSTKVSAVHSSRNKLIFLVILSIGLYVVLPQLGTFHDSFYLLWHASLYWIGLAILALAVTYIIAAAMYVLLAIRRLRYAATLVVQLASMFANRLLPAGIGAIGINYLYLRRNRHSQAAAGAVVAANNTLGLIGHALLFGLCLAVSHSSISYDFHLPHVSIHGVQVWLAAAIVALFVVAVLLFRRRAWYLMRGVAKQLAGYRTHPTRLVVALLCSMTLTLFYTGVLYASCRAIGLHLSAIQVFIGLTVGVAGGTITPTPGGLGGAEAGLVAGLMLSGIATSSAALAAALLYRLCTYWLALIVGAGAFALAEHKRYI